jgi:rubrerythrin
LFEKYNVPIPVDNARDYSKAPASLRESFEAGVRGEIENIAMYNRFLGQNIPEDVRNVFTRLKNASQNHLKAFQKGLSR